MTEMIRDGSDSVPSKKFENTPRHIGIIMDGNRRFAKSLGLDPRKGHEYGEKKVQNLVEWCKEFDIKELTLYSFSIQNFNRPKKEFNYIMKLFAAAATRLLNDERLEKYEIKVKFLGRINMFPKNIQDLINKIEEKTKNNKEYRINFAMAYGGKEEIIDGIKNLVDDVKKGIVKKESINEELFEKYVYNSSEPDLIIRTGGEKRTSNFLMWQSSYSEWIFLDKSWPKFEKEDFEKCIEDFSNRERRIGR